MLFLRLLKESLLFAFTSLKLNKLRTFLSLLGITIGIFIVIMIFTVVDSLEKNIRNSITDLGSNIVFIQKWPWGTGGEYPWWKYLKRPHPKIKEAKAIEHNCTTAKSVTFCASTTATVKYKNNSIENASIFFVSKHYEQVFSFNLSKGRFFSLNDHTSGKNFAVIGFNIAENLFANQDPLGKTIKLLGRNIFVIGVFEKKGKDILATGYDDNIVLPVNFAKNLIDVEADEMNPLIVVRAKDETTNEELKQELKKIMRLVRRLRPLEEDNFALNEIGLLSQGIKQLFKTLTIAGWIIGGFSILVGGFGIANIMFVSVKERTNIIGIQKSLGAKNYFILFQFLFEAIFLCVFGGLIGLFLVYIGSIIGTSIIGMNLALSPENIIRGLFVSIAIGIISGFIPSYYASKMNPVDAIRVN